MNPNMTTEDCPICLEPFVGYVAEINQQPNSCGHKFCVSCFLRHLEKFRSSPQLYGTMTCPLCRRVYLGVSFWDFCILHSIYPPNVETEQVPETRVVPLFQDLSEFDADSSDSDDDDSDDSSYEPSESSEEVADDPYMIIDLTSDLE